MRIKTTLRYATSVCGALLFGAVLCTVPMVAQGRGAVHSMSPEQQQVDQKMRLDALSKILSLTPGQANRIKAINDDTLEKMMGIRKSGEDPSTARPKIAAIRADQHARIKALLTSGQQSKYEAHLAATMPQDRRSEGGAPAGAAATGAVGSGSPPPTRQ